MQLVRRALLAVAALVGTAVPALAQNSMSAAPAAAPGGADMGNGALLWVWVWILIAGIAIFIVGTSMGQQRR